VPDFSTLCRRQKTLAVELPDQGSGGPLHLPADSTGIEVRGEGWGGLRLGPGDRDPDERHARKHGGARRRARHRPRTNGGQGSRRKAHLAIDEGEEDQETVRGTVSPTNREVRAIEITGSGVGDAPILPGLLAQIPEGEPIASITADGAYDGRACRDAIADRGAEAIIPPRRNDEPWKMDSPGARGRNRALRTIIELELTRFHGHLESSAGGVLDDPLPPCLSAGVPAPDGRPRPVWPHARGAGPRVRTERGLDRRMGSPRRCRGPMPRTARGPT
jgi:transposase